MSSREVDPLLKLLGYSDPEVHFVTPNTESSIEILTSGESADDGYAASLHSTLPSRL